MGRGKLGLFRGRGLRSTTTAAAAKSLQSCPTLCDPIDSSPLGSPIPGILQARTLEWVAISPSNAWKWKVKVKSLSRVRLLATPWTAAYQAPPSMGFSRQEYWSGVPLPSPLRLVKNCFTYFGTPMLGTYIFLTYLLDELSPLSLCNVHICLFLPFFGLKPILSHMSMVTPAFLGEGLPFAWSIIFHPFTLSLFVCL